MSDILSGMRAHEAQSLKSAILALDAALAAREPLRAPNPLLTMDRVSAGYRSIDEDTQAASDKIIVSGGWPCTTGAVSWAALCCIFKNEDFPIESRVRKVQTLSSDIVMEGSLRLTARRGGFMYSCV